MKRILIATVLAIGLTTAGGYAYAHGSGGGSEYGGHGMMMGGGGYGMMDGAYGMGPGMMEDYGFNKGGHHFRALPVLDETAGPASKMRNSWMILQNCARRCTTNVLSIWRL